MHLDVNPAHPAGLEGEALKTKSKFHIHAQCTAEDNIAQVGSLCFHLATHIAADHWLLPIMLARAIHNIA